MEPAALLAAFDNRWTFHPKRQQKGVDTLIVLDLVRLAGRGAIDAAILISGDRDLAEAVRAAQDFGLAVSVANPGRGLSPDVAKLADHILGDSPRVNRPGNRGASVFVKRLLVAVWRYWIGGVRRRA